MCVSSCAHLHQNVVQVRAAAWRAFAHIAEVFPALLSRQNGQEAFASAFSQQEKSAMVRSAPVAGLQEHRSLHFKLQSCEACIVIKPIHIAHHRASTRLYLDHEYWVFRCT